MKKIVISFAAFMSLLVASSAMAEVGFQFRIPFAVTKQATVNNPSGSSFLLSFDVDSATTVGILEENVAYNDTKVAAGTATTYNVTALRMMKNVGDAVSVGLDLGNMTQVQGAAVVGTGYMADIVGSAKLLSSKGGKVNSYMNVELLYRLAQTSAVVAAATPNLGGVQLAIGAGINF